jgi:signal transduction histidine kinase
VTSLRRLGGLLRVRIAVAAILIVALVSVLLDAVFANVLPLSPEVVRIARRDLIGSGIAVALLCVLTTVLGLRRVVALTRTIRLGLGFTSLDRVRALQEAFRFPLLLTLLILGAGTLGNVATFAADLLGRTTLTHNAWHTTVVSQCMMVGACFLLFVAARSALRPVVLALADDQDEFVPQLGLRHRTGLLVGTLVALVSGPSVSLVSLQLDARAAAERQTLQRDAVRLLVREAARMGGPAFTRQLAGTPLRGALTTLAVDPRGRVTPGDLGPLWRRAARLSPDRGPWREHDTGVQRVVAAPLRTADGTFWVGVVDARPHPRGDRPGLTIFLVAMLGLGTFLAYLLGATVVRETQVVTRRLADLASGQVPADLPTDAGTLAEMGRLIDAINELLQRTDLLRVRDFVAIEQAQEAARSKTQFLANMSHDLRAPLTAIFGFSDFLAQGVNGPLTPGQRQHCEQVRAAARRLQRQIDTLLDVAKLDAGRLKLVRTWVAPVSLISKAVQGLGQHRDQAPTGLQVEVQPGLPPVFADADRSGQALALIVEEIRSHHPDAVLRLRAGRLDTGGDPAVEIRIDLPEGTFLDLPAETLFEPLVVLEGRRVLRLNLHLAHRLAERQHGRLEPVRDERGITGFRLGFSLNVTGERPAIGG